MTPLPYRDIRALFLDAGNTMIAMDFDWVCNELGKHGIFCAGPELQRAEAAARPIISKNLHEFETRKEFGGFEWYFRTVLEQLTDNRVPDKMRIAEIAQELTPVLLPDGTARRLWTFVLPGVRNALAKFEKLGLQMVVVSNSDGTVEEQLAKQGLRPYFEAVIDSHHVGFSKPDPRIFEQALEISGAQPEHTLYVGDIYDVDVVGARAAGLHAVLLDPYDDWSVVDCEKFNSLLDLAETFVNHFNPNLQR